MKRMSWQPLKPTLDPKVRTERTNHTKTYTKRSFWQSTQGLKSNSPLKVAGKHARLLFKHGTKIFYI